VTLKAAFFQDGGDVALEIDFLAGNGATISGGGQQTTSGHP
jgi:hypothetical protein